MKKLILLFVMLSIFTGCSNNDDGEEINCELFDPAFPVLFVRIVDASGNNLIENGTIDPQNITVQLDSNETSFQFIPADEFANPNAEIRQFDNTILLSVPYESTFQYTIHINETDSFNVDFSAELTNIPCDLSYYKPTGAVYNNEAIPLTELSLIQILAVVEL